MTPKLYLSLTAVLIVGFSHQAHPTSQGDNPFDDFLPPKITRAEIQRRMAELDDNHPRITKGPSSAEETRRILEQREKYAKMKAHQAFTSGAHTGDTSAEATTASRAAYEQAKREAMQKWPL